MRKLIHRPWKDQVYELAFSPDGSRLAAAGRRGEVAIFGAWDRAAPVVWPVDVGELWTLAWSPHGVLVGGHLALLLLDPDTGEVRLRVELRSNVPRMRLSPDGRFVAVRLATRSAKVVRVYEAADLTARVEHPIESAYPGFDVTDEALYVAAGKDQRLVEVSIANGAIQEREPERVTAVRALGDGALALLRWRGQESISVLGADDAPRWSHPYPWSEIYACRLARSPDGSRVASGWRLPDEVMTARVWSANDGSVEASVRHPRGVRALCFSPDGATFATAGGDRTVRTWSLAE